MKIVERINVKYITDIPVIHLFFLMFFPPFILSSIISFTIGDEINIGHISRSDIMAISIFVPLLETAIVIVIVKVLSAIGLKNYLYQSLMCAGLFTLDHYFSQWVSAVNLLGVFYSFLIMAMVFSIESTAKSALKIFFIHALNNSLVLVLNFIY